MAERSGYRLLLILGLLLVGLLVIVPLFGMFMWAPMMMGRGMMGALEQIFGGESDEEYAQKRGKEGKL
jgi:hypothetical protein